ncbi:MAG: CHAP domain-containing protein [Nitrosomonadales bacterium]|nr:CHAP domain-containing protein [Nitrosomonadales bacterium]
MSENQLSDDQVEDVVDLEQFPEADTSFADDEIEDDSALNSESDFADPSQDPNYTPDESTLDSPIVTTAATNAVIERVLNVARAEIGVVEGPGENNVKYNTWYYHGHPVSGKAYPWCAVFVSWVFYRADASGMHPKGASTVANAQWFKDRGAFGSAPRVGAVSFYNISGLGRISHTGIVERVLNDGSFYAIEGNTDERGGRTGGKVMRKHRKNLGPGGGFGYPAYSGRVGPAPTPTPPPKPIDPNAPLVVDGNFGPATIAKLQAALNKSIAARLTVDGDFGPASKKALQRYLGVPQDGKIGLNTVKALQRFVGVAQDGKWGPGTTKAIQRTLNDGKWNHPAKPGVPKPVVPPGPNLKVDGNFGTSTIKATQRAIGVKDDGVWGPASKRALQHKLGVTADGVIGPATIKALQHHVGVSTDGKWGAETTKGMQRALNAGRF